MDNESIVKLIAKWRSRSQTFTNRAAANRYGRCADELEDALRSPPPDEGIAGQQEQENFSRGGTSDAVGRQDLPQSATGDSSTPVPDEFDADIPQAIRREALDCAAIYGRISYDYLCDLWRRGKDAGYDLGFGDGLRAVRDGRREQWCSIHEACEVAERLEAKQAEARDGRREEPATLPIVGRLNVIAPTVADLRWQEEMRRAGERETAALGREEAAATAASAE